MDEKEHRSFTHLRLEIELLSLTVEWIEIDIKVTIVKMKLVPRLNFLSDESDGWQQMNLLAIPKNDSTYFKACLLFDHDIIHANEGV